MQFDFWQVFVLAVVPPALVGAINWLLNRRTEQKRAAVQNDSTVVTTVTDAMDALNEELTRVRADLRAMEKHAQYVTALLDAIAVAMERHQKWDEAQVQAGAPEPPRLPTIPRWWEIRTAASSKEPVIEDKD